MRLISIIECDSVLEISKVGHEILISDIREKRDRYFKRNYAMLFFFVKITDKRQPQLRHLRR